MKLSVRLLEQVSPHLDERVFTYNMRDLTDFGRFAFVLHQTAGRRLTWLELTS